MVKKCDTSRRQVTLGHAQLWDALSCSFVPTLFAQLPTPQSVSALCWYPLLKHCFSTTTFCLHGDLLVWKLVWTFLFSPHYSSSLISAEGGNVKWKKRRYIYTQACSSIVEVQVCDRVECHRTIIAIPDRAQKLAWEFKYMGKRMRLCNILEGVPPPITLL